MKKLLAMLLAVVMVFGLAACGANNENEVAILWSGDGIVHVPNSLINAVERAMYIEGVSYAHYGANDDQAEQIKQAKAALDAGCAALVVQLVDPTAAQEIVDAAKAKSIPVVFVYSDVDAAVLASYDKCASVVSDAGSIGSLLESVLADVMKKDVTNVEGLDTNKDGTASFGEKVSGFFSGISQTVEVISAEAYDRNQDGTVSYAAVGDVEAITAAMAELPLTAIPGITDVSGINSLVFRDGATEKDLGQLIAPNGDSVELIITPDDATAQAVLKILQKRGFNSNRLKTHAIPVYTVGNEVDAKSFLSPENYEPDEWEALIYTTTDLIGGGFLSGAAVTDYDSTAIAMAKIVANMIKGSDRFDGIDAASVSGSIVKIPYTTN